MIKTVSALLLSASVFAAAPASAADLLKFTFAIQGNLTTTYQTRVTMPVTKREAYSNDLVFYLPASAAGTASYSGPGLLYSYTRPVNASVDSSGLSVSETSSMIEKSWYNVFELSLSSCTLAGQSGSGFGTIPGAGSYSLSACNVSYDFVDQSFPNIFKFVGTASALTVTAIQGDPADIGYVTGVPGIPEPATWAMMLIGFASIAATVRRQRHAIACA